MSDYSSSALIAFREKLKTSVAMKPHLIGMLEEQAGGFMARAEAQSVRSAKDPMGRLIEILLGKGDREFNTFCYAGKEQPSWMGKEFKTGSKAEQTKER